MTSSPRILSVATAVPPYRIGQDEAKDFARSMFGGTHRDIVGAFMFSNDGFVLLGKSGAGGVYQDMWLCPGGGIDPGETKLQALKREVMEEVSLIG